MLPFYISIENQNKEVETVVEKTFSLIERIANVKIPRKYIGSAWGNGEFGSMDWYIRKANNPRRKQVNTTKMWKLFEQEPWQKNRHYELSILDKDLYVEGTNFVFGETKVKIAQENGMIISDYYASGKPNVSGIIISTNRIKKWYGNDWKPALFGILMHEEGHFYGLPHLSNPNYITIRNAKNMLDAGHCNDRLCIMEQVNIERRLDLLSKIKLVKQENPLLFCRHDLAKLKENLNKLYG